MSRTAASTRYITDISSSAPRVSVGSWATNPVGERSPAASTPSFMFSVFAANCRPKLPVQMMRVTNQLPWHKYDRYG